MSACTVMSLYGPLRDGRFRPEERNEEGGGREGARCYARVIPIVAVRVLYVMVVFGLRTPPP